MKNKIHIVERPSQHKRVTSPQNEYNARQKLIEQHKQEQEKIKERQSLIESIIIGCITIIIVLLLSWPKPQDNKGDKVIYVTPTLLSGGEYEIKRATIEAAPTMVLNTTPNPPISGGRVDNQTIKPIFN